MQNTALNKLFDTGRLMCTCGQKCDPSGNSHTDLWVNPTIPIHWILLVLRWTIQWIFWTFLKII